MRHFHPIVFSMHRFFFQFVITLFKIHHIQSSEWINNESTLDNTFWDDWLMGFRYSTMSVMEVSAILTLAAIFLGVYKLQINIIDNNCSKI